MEQRLKERLTGAAILVALVVLVVPELFHGQVADRSSRAAATEGPPLRSYTIDLGGSHTAPMQLSTPTARADAPATPAATVSTPTAAAPPVAAALDEPAPAAPAAAAPPRSAPAVSARSHVVPKRVSLVHPPAEHHEPQTAAGWSVQLGLFAKRVNAEHLVHTAQAKGFSASLSSPDAHGRYHVRVAGLTTRSQAVTLAARLRAAGLPAATVGPAVASEPPGVAR